MMQYEICACCGKPKRSKPNAKRFPSNLLLSHDPRCIARGTKRVKANRIGAPNQHERTEHPTYGKYEYTGGSTFYSDEHGLEEVQDFECVEGCPVRILGEQAGESKSSSRLVYHNPHTPNAYGAFNNPRITGGHEDEGSKARYFTQFHDPLSSLEAPFHYFSKSSRKDRNSGLEGMPTSASSRYGKMNGTPEHTPKHDTPEQNDHPTVKSLALCRWLCRLVGVPGGVILDPFAGSGSTLCAAIQEGFHFIGIEQDAHYCDIARARIAHTQQEAKRAESEGQEYQCVDSCPIKQLDAQSGIRKSGARIHPVGEAWPIWDTDTSKRARHTEYEASEGGASRYFQQFAPEPVSLWDEEVAE